MRKHLNKIISTILVVFFLLSFNSVSAATFGYTTVGSNSSTLLPNYIGGTVATLPVAGVISKITFRVVSGLAAGEKVRGGIYDSSGNYLNLETEEFSAGTGSNTWVDLNFTSPPTLAAGTYMLVVYTDGTFLVAADSGSSGQVFDNTVKTYPTWPASVNHASTFIKSVYATYTAVSSGRRMFPGLIR